MTALIKHIEILKNSERQLESLSFYTKKAKQTIKRHARNLMRDEDAIAYITFYIMRGDLNWNPEKSSRKTYLYNCAKWGIKTYLTHYKKRKKYISINKPIKNAGDGDLQLHEILPSPDKEPEDIAANSELKKNLDILLDTLSVREKECINSYFYTNQSYEEIGKKYNITRERVRQIIQNGLFKLRKKMEDA